jgi:subtilisin family serine protease
LPFLIALLVQRNFTGESEEDLDGHGTHCAGTIFGRDVDGKRIGVAPQVPTAVIGKVIGAAGADSDVIVTAIEWALGNDAQVISMSLGFDFPGMVVELEREGVPTELATSMALEGYRANILLFERLGSLVQARATFTGPCLLVAAAGNESAPRSAHVPPGGDIVHVVKGAAAATLSSRVFRSVRTSQWKGCRMLPARAVFFRPLPLAPYS